MVRGKQQARTLMLSRLTGIYELAPLIGQEVAEAIASKLQVQELQACASTLLKVQVARGEHLTNTVLARLTGA